MARDLDLLRKMLEKQSSNRTTDVNAKASKNTGSSTKKSTAVSTTSGKQSGFTERSKERSTSSGKQGDLNRKTEKKNSFSGSELKRQAKEKNSFSGSELKRQAKENTATAGTARTETEQNADNDYVELLRNKLLQRRSQEVSTGEVQPMVVGDAVQKMAQRIQNADSSDMARRQVDALELARDMYDTQAGLRDIHSNAGEDNDVLARLDERIAEAERDGADPRYINALRDARDRAASGEEIPKAEIYGSDADLNQPEGDQWRNEIDARINQAYELVEQREEAERNAEYQTHNEVRWGNVRDEMEAAGWEFDVYDLVDFRWNEYENASVWQRLVAPVVGENPKEYYTLEQASIYSYLMAQGREDEAKEYAEYADYAASERRNRIVAETEAEMDWNPVYRTMRSVAANPFKVINSVDIMAQTAFGEGPVNYNRSNQAGVVSDINRQVVTERLDAYGDLNGFLSNLTGREVDIPVLGDLTWGSIYGIGVDNLNSMVNAAVFTPGLAGTAMGVEKFSDEYVDAMERGGTESQAFKYALGSAFAEGLGESIEFSSYLSGLAKIGRKPGIKGILGAGLLQAAEGAVQEGATTYMEQTVDKWFMGENSKYNINVREYMAQGYDRETAEAMAQDDAENEMFMSALLGGIGGGSMMLTSAPAAVYDSVQADRYIPQDIVNNMMSYYDELSKSMPDTEYIDEAPGFWDRFSGGPDQESLNDANEIRLATIKDALIRSAQGRKLHGEAKRLFNDDEAAQETLKAYKAGAFGRTERTGTEQKDKAAATPRQAAATANEASGTAQETKQKAEQLKNQMAVGSDGKSTVNGEEVRLQGIKPSTGRNGEATISVTARDGSAQEVKLSEVTFGDDTTAEVYSYAADMATADLANQFRVLLGADQQIERVANGMTQAYDMGLAGYRNIETVRGSALTQGLTEQQLTAAYNLGVADRQKGAETRQTVAETMQGGYAPNKWRSGRVNMGTVAYDNLSTQQQRDLDIVDVVAWVFGINIDIFESQANEAGQYTAENGSYNRKTNTISLDVNAGRNNVSDSMAQTAMLKTLSHELTHAIQRNSPKQYRMLADAVTDVLEQQGENIDELVTARMARDANLTTREMAMDEIVADACETMLRDSDALERLQKLHPEAAKTFRQKVLELVKKLKEAIRDAFGGARLSREARAIEKQLDDIARLWSEGAVQTAEVSGREYIAEDAVGPFDEPARPEAAHIDQRTWQNVADRKVKAFLNEYKFARGYLPNAAEVLLADLNNSVHGERYQTPDGEWIGQKRQTSDKIADMLDHGMTWDEIRQGLETISGLLESGDLENDIPNSTAIKRTEIILDEMLTEGYRALDGTVFAASEDYAAYKQALPGAIGQKIPDAPKGSVRFEEALRYSRRIELTETTLEHIRDDKPVGGTDEIKHSLRYDEDFMDAALAKNRQNGFVTAATMKKAAATRAAIRDFFRDPNNKELLRLPADEMGNTFVSDLSYGGSEENTTVCIRSMAAQQLMDAIGKELGRPLTVDDTLLVSQEIAALTDKPECFYCYVATDRRAYREYLGRYIDQRDETIRKYRAGADRDALYEEFLAGREPTKHMKRRYNMWLDAVDNGLQLITKEDLASVEDLNKELAVLSQQPGARSKGSRYNQLRDAVRYTQGASWAKAMRGYAAYNNHILRWPQKRVDRLNKGYGLRMYSFSDYSPAFVLENMQMITDAAVRGLNVLAYTKEIDFAEIFAPTGTNINVSVFASEVNGEIINNEMEGANWEQAKALREKYPNVGIAMVATNDRILEWALEQDWIDTVIPYHLVRTGKRVAEYFGYKNYTSVSSDKKTLRYKKGNPKTVYPQEHHNDLVAYVDALERYGLSPRFQEHLKGYEEYIAGEITPRQFREMNPNYMKLVNETRRSYDQTEAVQPVFDLEAAKRSVDTMIRQGGYYQPIGGTLENQEDIAEEIAGKIREKDDAVQYSQRQLDDAYMDAVERGDEARQTELVREAAKRAGYDSPPLYHGTRSFGFTEFNLGESMDKATIWLSDNPQVSQSYVGEGAGIRDISSGSGYTRDMINKADSQKLAEMVKETFGLELHAPDAQEKRQLYQHQYETLLADRNEIRQLLDQLGADEALAALDAAEATDMVKTDVADISRALGDYGQALREAAKGAPAATARKLTGAADRLTMDEIQYLIDVAQDDILMNDDGIWQTDEVRRNIERNLQGIYELYGQTENLMEVQAGGKHWTQVDGKIIGRPGEKVHPREIAAYAMAHGYSGVVFRQMIDQGVATSGGYVPSDIYAYFNPDQVKSADPVTRDDNGDVIPLSERFESGENDLRYQTRDPAEISTREILANALESATHDEHELGWLRQYKAQFAELNAKQAMLQENRAIIRELSFKKGRTGEENTRLQQAKVRAEALRNEIDRVDRGLLRLEKADVIRGLVEREGKRVRALAADITKQKVQDVRDTQKSEALRKNIVTRVKRLDQMLRQPSDQKHIPETLRGALIDLMSTITQMGDTFGSGANDLARLAAARREYAMLAGDGGTSGNDTYIAGLYDDDTRVRIEILEQIISEKRMFGRKKDMRLNSDELDKLSKIIAHFEFIIKNENKVFVDGRKQNIEMYADRIWQQTNGKKRKENWATDQALIQALKQLAAGNVTPVYFFKHLGGAMGELGNSILEAEGTYGRNLAAARDRIQQIMKKHNYSKWSKQKATFELETDTGEKLKLTAGQALGIWATAKRERTGGNKTNHLLQGGVIIDRSRQKKGLKSVEIDENGMPLNVREIRRIDAWLTDEMKAYADEMVEYISKDMAELGNETSMQLHGYRKFGEGYYYPFKTSSDFRSTDLSKIEASLFKNMGFTKATMRGANTPVVITDFTETVAEHVNSMLLYNALAVPQDSFMRVYDHKVDKSHAVKSLLKNAFGKPLNQYIEQFMRDLYGATTRNALDSGLGSTLTGMSKRQAVLASLSVIVQQPSAMMRAMSMVNPKYFRSIVAPDKYFREAMKYSGTAVLKNAGGFDTNMSRGAAAWLMDDQGGIRDRVNDALGKGAEYADRITWAEMWQAVKREQAVESGLDINSEELKVLAGKRFDEVMRRTQVYDSIMTKSEHMRSKSWYSKAVTAFMAEPTVTYNMMLDAWHEARKGNNKTAAATVFSVLGSIILNNTLKSFVTAARDDDDDKATYWERYIKGFADNSINDLLPMNYIPVIRDVWSLAMGYDVERADMSVLNSIMQATEILMDEDADDNKKQNAIIEVVSYMTGLPAKNIWRDASAMINTWETLTGDREYREGWLGNAVRSGVTANIPRYDSFAPSSTERLYAAALAENDGTFGKQKQYMMDYEGMDEEKINTKLRTRISDAYTYGEITEGDARRMLVDYTGIDYDEAYMDVEEWKYEREGGTWNGKFTKVYDAIDANDEDALTTALTELYKHGGYSDTKNGAQTIAGNITSRYKPQYIEAAPNERTEMEEWLLDAYETVYVTAGEEFDREARRKDIRKWAE